MSARDQSLFVATMSYHLGHSLYQRCARLRSLCRRGHPAVRVRRARTAPAFRARGARAVHARTRSRYRAWVDPANAFYQRSLGADLFVAPGWRLDGPAGTRWYANGVPDLAMRAALRSGFGNRARWTASSCGANSCLRRSIRRREPQRGRARHRAAAPVAGSVRNVADASRRRCRSHRARPNWSRACRDGATGSGTTRRRRAPRSDRNRGVSEPLCAPRIATDARADSGAHCNVRLLK